MKKSKNILIVIGVLAFVAILIVIARSGASDEKKVKVGFILSGSATESGWNGMHYNGAKDAAEQLGVELLVKENVKEFTGQCEKAVRELAEEGAGMIILSSYGYSEEMQEVVKEYPDIVFYGNSSEYHDENMTSYFARMYQARYFAGILAGMRTEGNQIGYVAAMPNNEVNRGINAFTLGVQRVNPEAVVYVAWTGEWDNKEAELNAANKLIEEKAVDVITYHQNQDNVIAAADAAGVDSIGYHQEFSGYSKHYLTSVVCNWETLYYEIIKEFLQGRGNSVNNYWIGIEKDVVDLTTYSSLVTKEMQEEIATAKNEILAGKSIFSGTIYDRDGTLRCGETEIISDEMLLEHFDWFVEGVEFYEEYTE